MKYTIEGFNQKEVIKLGKLDVIDLVILRWIVDFEPKMAKKEIDGEIYFWINYQSLLEALPILNIQKLALYRRLEKMCDADILKHKNVKDKGNYSYYSFGDNYINLISQKIEPCISEDRTLLSSTIEQNNSSIKETNLLNNSNTPYNPPKGKFNDLLFDKFWNAYPRKVSKGNAEKWFTKNKPSEELVNEMIDKINLLKTTEQWKKNNGQYIPYPSTWLNAKGWEDEISSDGLIETEEEEIARLKAEVERRKANGDW